MVKRNDDAPAAAAPAPPADAAPADAAPAAALPRRRMSEGVREEIARTGRAVDPSTGRVLTRDDL